MNFKVWIGLILLQMIAVCLCAKAKQTNGKREGFKSQEQEVVIVSPDAITAADNSTADTTNMATGKPKRKRKRLTARIMMAGLKRACKHLRKFASDSKYAKEVKNGNISAEMLSHELKLIESGDQCGVEQYSSALKVFLKTCTVIETCPVPTSKPTFDFNFPDKNKPAHENVAPSRITQLYVVVPTVFTPTSAAKTTVTLNSRNRNSGASGPSVSSSSREPATVVNYSNLPSSLPSWIPAPSLVNQPEYRTVTNQGASNHRANQQQRQNMISLPALLDSNTRDNIIDLID